MSAGAVAKIIKSLRQAPWQLWLTQVGAVLRIEIRKNL